MFVPDFQPFFLIVVSPCILKPLSQCFLCLVAYIKLVAVSRLSLLILEYVRSYFQVFPHPPDDSEFPFPQTKRTPGFQVNHLNPEAGDF